jgi:hypothetical protein
MAELVVGVFVSGDRLASSAVGESRLELIEVRAAGFGMPKLEEGETAVIGHFGIEVDDLEHTKAELRRRGVVLEDEAETDDVRFIFTAPQPTFG